MKTRGLLLIVILSALSTVACGKDKPSQKEMVNACLFDPTGNCPRQAAAMAKTMAPEVLPLVNANVPNGNPNLPGVVSLANVDDALIKKTAAKVDAAIKADSLNPNSIHYDPPQSVVPKREAAAIEAASALPTQNEQVGLPVISGGSGDGEAVR